MSLYLVLGVEAAVWSAIKLVPVPGQGGLGAKGADLGQARIFLDLDTPALVIGQVPVQGIEFVEGHEIDERLDLGNTELMTGDIQQQPAPAKGRGIADEQRGDLPGDAVHFFPAHDFWWQQLPQCLHAI